MCDQAEKKQENEGDESLHANSINAHPGMQELFPEQCSKDKYS